MNRFTQPAIIGFYGYSRSGKTSLITHIIDRLSKKGIAIGVVKITDKPISSEPEGKDTHVFRQFGAVLTTFSSAAETSFALNQALDIQDILQIIGSNVKVDLVIIEGAHSDLIPKIRVGDIPLRHNTLLTFSGNIDEIEATINSLLTEKGKANEDRN